MSDLSLRDRKYQSLRAALGIDLMRIDQDLVDYPSLLTEACELCAEVTRTRDMAANTLRLTEAEEAGKLRATPTPEGKTRSEERIKSEVPMAEPVAAALFALEEAKAEQAKWSALVEGLRAKGSSLKRVAELITAGFLSPNAVYQDRREELARRRRPLPSGS